MLGGVENGFWGNLGFYLFDAVAGLGSEVGLCSRGGVFGGFLDLR